MNWLAFLFEGALAALMIVLIVYCVRLDRRLSAVRADEPQIGALIARLVETSERAEASVERLKAAGIAQERALRAAMGEAEALRTRLTAGADQGRRPVAATVPATGRPAEGRASPDAAAVSPRPLAVPATRPKAAAAMPQPETPRPESRDEAEQALIEAIRHARAAG